MKRLFPYFVGALVGMLMMTAFFAGRASASPLATTGCFPDTNGHWAETFICWMKDNGVSTGFPDGTYKPENGVTRAEMSVMLNRVGNWMRATGTQFDSGIFFAGSVAPNTTGSFATVTITAPVSGALVVNSSLNLFCSGGVFPVCSSSSGNTFINVDGTQYGRTFFAIDSAGDENDKAWGSSNSAYVPVAAGAHTVKVDVQNSSGSAGSVYVWSGGINVIFVPFNGTGGVPALPAPPPPADGPQQGQ